MKNVYMTINSNAIQSYTPAASPVPPAPPSPFSAPPPLIQEYSVSFTIKFENEDEAIAFAKVMLGYIENFKSSYNTPKRNDY